MDEEIRRMIVQAAEAATGWKANTMEVYEEERLRRPLCSFYTVGSNARMHTDLANFALVGDKVVGVGDGSTVAKILDTCSHDAPADWWAEIVTRYHRDLGRGLVLQNETVRRDVIRKLTAAGKSFTPPVMDKDKQSLTYLLLDPELNIVYRIHATRTPGGPIRVEKAKVLPAAA